MREIWREIDFKPMIGPASFERNHFRAAINVPLDKVTAQWRAGDERPFEVYQTFTSKLFQVRAIERLLEQIERQLFIAPRTHRQTAAIHRYAIANCGFSCQPGRRDLKLCAAFGHPDPKHFGDFLNQAGKHGRDVTAGSLRSQLQTVAESNPFAPASAGS